MTLHILRCHNRNLYLGMSLLILFACAYTLQRDDINALQHYGSIAASVITALWGGYYYLLHYLVDDKGITRCLLGKTHYSWDDIAALELIRVEKNSQLSLSLLATLHSRPERPLRLSSELLSLPAMESLIAELEEQGRLPRVEEPQSC